MTKLRGAFYKLDLQGELGARFVQTEEDADFATVDREHGNALETRIPVGERAENPRYYDVTKSGKPAFILIPRGRDRYRVAEALRDRFGPNTVLHFQGYPRDHEVIPASEAAAFAARA